MVTRNTFPLLLICDSVAAIRDHRDRCCRQAGGGGRRPRPRPWSSPLGSGQRNAPGPVGPGAFSYVAVNLPRDRRGSDQRRRARRNAATCRRCGRWTVGSVRRRSRRRRLELHLRLRRRRTRVLSESSEVREQRGRVAIHRRFASRRAPVDRRSQKASTRTRPCHPTHIDRSRRLQFSTAETAVVDKPKEPAHDHGHH